MACLFGSGEHWRLLRQPMGEPLPGQRRGASRRISSRFGHLAGDGRSEVQRCFQKGHLTPIPV